MSALTSSNVVLNTQEGPIIVPWAQFLSRAGSVDDYEFGPGEGHAVLTFLVYEDDLSDFTEQVLGYPTVTSLGGISRSLPICHPRVPRMWAHKITSVRPAVPGDKETPLTGGIPIADYSFCYVTVLFKQPPYPVLDDTQIAQTYGANAPEYYRFSWVERETTMDIVSLPGGYLKWSEGPAAGAQIDGPQTLRLPYRTFTLHWQCLPYLYIFNAAGNPTNLYSAEGCVNLNPFLGLPAGTVYCMPAKITPVEWPARQSTLGLPDYLPSLVIDLDLIFVYFNPPAGGTARGWNTLTFADMKFYGIEPATGAALPYPTYDFTNAVTGIFAKAQ